MTPQHLPAKKEIEFRRALRRVRAAIASSGLSTESLNDIADTFERLAELPYGAIEIRLYNMAKPSEAAPC